MNNFLFENKTKVYFGKGGVKEYLGCLLEHYGDTVMLAYGGGSIKHNGVYDEIIGILNAEGKRIVEFPGIMPNPTYAKVQGGAKLARENHVDLIDHQQALPRAEASNRRASTDVERPGRPGAESPHRRGRKGRSALRRQPKHRQ